MSDTNTTVAVAAPAAEPKHKRTRGPLNQGYLRKLTNAETIGAAAQDEDYASPLSQRDIDKDFVTELLADLDAARNKATEALQHTTAARSATAAEAKANSALHGALQEVQKAAKQKYARTNRIALGDYFVGKKLNGSRPNLLQTSQTILSKLAGDKLPGFTPAKIKGLGALRQGWIDAKVAQTDNTTAARTARAALKTLLKSIEDRKVAIQLAADAEWPHSEEENAAIRKEFRLSHRRPFKA